MEKIQILRDKVQRQMFFNTVINSGFHMNKEFLDQLSDNQLFKRDPVPQRVFTSIQDFTDVIVTSN